MNKRILFLMLSLLGTFRLYATHATGAQISYKCAGNGIYTVTVKIIRDCNGIQISQSPLHATCSSNSVNVTNQTKVSVRDITGIGAMCPIQSRCSGSYQYGFEEHVWTMTL